MHTAIEYSEIMIWEGVGGSEERYKVGKLLENLSENLARELLTVRGHCRH